MKTKHLILGLALAFPLASLAQTPASETATLTPKSDRAEVTLKRDVRVQATRPSVVRLGGDGTRGGGETVNLAGRPELRDLVETSACDWKTGDDLMAQTPHTARILQNLARFDWYFAIALEQEIRRLDYCLTGALVRVRTEDEDGLTAVVTEGTSQVAIRLFDSVYIDTSISERMNPRSQGYLLIHEAMHSFLKVDESLRNQKLRSMVRAIEGIEAGRITNRAAFNLQMSRNSIQFPVVAARLDHARQAIQFVLGNYATRLEILKQTSISNILQRTEVLDLTQLWEPHQDSFRSFSLSAVVQEVLFYDDAATLEVLVRTPGLEKTIVGLAYVYLNELENPQVAEWLSTQVTVASIAEETLRSLARRQARVNQNRIYIAGQEVLAVEGNSQTPASTLRALSTSSMITVSAQAKTYLSLLNKSLESGDLSAVHELTTGNAVFYQAFGIIELTTQVNQLSGVDAGERDLVRRNLRVMALAFWAYAENVAFSAQALEQWREIKADIDMNKLGYTF